METDGSLSGSEASEIAAHILVDHFSMVFGGAASVPVLPEAVMAAEQTMEMPSQETSLQNEINDTTLSTRAKNALTKNGIVTMAALQAMSNEDIGGLQGLGDKTIKEIIEFLGR
jgi:DNA-directed RNA polymerase alpha subunit